MVTPTWRPDGAAVVAAVDVAAGPFDLWEFPVSGGPVRRLTSVPGGALWPDVSPDGSQIVFIGSGDEGFDVYVTPYAPMAETLALDRDEATGLTAAPVDLVNGVPYRPWTTLRPTSWRPTIDDNGRRTRIGAALSGTDVLAYHRYDASVGWVVSAPSSLAAGDAAPDWRFDYAYDCWRPSWYGSVSSSGGTSAGPV